MSARETGDAVTADGAGGVSGRMANGGHSEEEDSPDDEAAQAAARAAATLEYDEFAAEINALSMAEALRVCELEGIAPRDSSLLGVRAALLLHF
eukprot:COSAG01_NODE_42535_length_439_cov_0.691176_1_plen_93_part_01